MRYRDSTRSTQANRRSAEPPAAALALAAVCLHCGTLVAAPARRQVFVDRLVAELRQQIEAAAFRHQLRHGTLGIAEVAEVARARGAGADAGGNAILRREGLVVDAVDAQRAFLHHAIVVVVLARTVGTRPRAQLAADAGVGIDQHDAVLGALVGGAGRADGDAGRRLAMQARAREMHGLARRTVADLVAVHAIEPGAVRIGAIGVLIRERRGVAPVVPFLAARRAGLAPDAGVEIDHQPKLLRRRLGKRGHGPAPLTAAATGWGSGSKRGEVSAGSCAPAFSIRTLRSYQAACPVTGSLLEKR